MVRRERRVIRGVVVALAAVVVVVLFVRATRNDFGMGRNMEIMLNLYLKLSILLVSVSMKQIKYAILY